MLKVRVDKDEIRIGRHLSITFQRTLRIPDDGETYPLPPALGRFPVCRVTDYARNVPSHWLEHQGVFIPMYQREALWLAFDGASWRPNAVQVAVGKINAISGEAWGEGLSSAPQNYLVCPDQPWLDGINAGEGVIRQFVAMPMGMGYSIEAQLIGREEYGGIQISVFEPRPGRFPDRPPHRPKEFISGFKSARRAALASMGLGAGGKMQQKIYPDEYGLNTWDQENSGSIFVHILNSEHYSELTGHAPPPTPISAGTYTEHGFPWFELYDEGKGDVAASEKLTKVKSVREKDEKAVETLDKEAFRIEPGQVEKIRLPAKRRKPPAR